MKIRCSGSDLWQHNRQRRERCSALRRLQERVTSLECQRASSARCQSFVAAVASLRRVHAVARYMCSKTGSSGNRSLTNISFTSFQRLSAASIYPASQLTTERYGIRSSFVCAKGRLQSPPFQGSRCRSKRCYRPDGGCSGELTGGIRLVMIRGWMKAFAG